MNNQNNYEEEMMMQAKIAKREKVDTILAYILLVILVLAIGIVLYLKFIKKEDTKPTEKESNYISINEIVSRFNTSTLTNKYTNDGATLIATTNNNTIIITYTKDSNNTTITIPTMNNELEITLDKENEELTNDIYKELTSIICTYYGNSEDNCRTAVDKINSDIPGVRFVMGDDNNYVYIDTTKSIDVTTINSIKTYTEEIKFGLAITDYILNINNTEITNITINNTDTGLNISGNIKNQNNEGALSINVKLYDGEGNIVSENKKEYTSENPLEDSDTFEVTFNYDDSLNKENVKEYSINIIR